MIDDAIVSCGALSGDKHTADILLLSSDEGCCLQESPAVRRCRRLGDT
jgi:hypothetical protein